MQKSKFVVNKFQTVKQTKGNLIDVLLFF